MLRTALILSIIVVVIVFLVKLWDRALLELVSGFLADDLVRADATTHAHTPVGHDIRTISIIALLMLVEVHTHFICGGRLIILMYLLMLLLWLLLIMDFETGSAKCGRVYLVTTALIAILQIFLVVFLEWRGWTACSGGWIIHAKFVVLAWFVTGDDLFLCACI